MVGWCGIDTLIVYKLSTGSVMRGNFGVSNMQDVLGTAVSSLFFFISEYSGVVHFLLCFFSVL